MPDPAAVPAGPGLSGSRLFLAVAAISLGTMLTIIDGAIATVALPTIARDLKVDESSAVLVVTVYQLVLVMTLLPFSALGDRIGLKRLYQGGQLVFTVAPWPWVFAMAAPFAIVSLALGRWALPDVPPRGGEGYNLAGAMLNMATFGLLISGLEALVHGNSPVVSGAIVVIGLLFGAILVFHERQEPHPILPVDLLSRPVLALSVTGAFIAFSASQMITLSLPFRLQHGYGFSPSAVGAMLAPWPLTTMIVAPIAGTLSDRYPAGLLGGVGMIVATVALALFALLPAHPTVFDVAWRMSLCGAGFGLFLSPNARLIVGSAPRERAASAGGLVSTTRLVGQTLGATGVATVLALGYGDTLVPPILAGMMTVLAGLFSIARLRPSIRNPSARETAVVQPGGHGDVGAA